MKTRIIVLLVITLLMCTGIYSQNIVITDDDSYTANPSAMLDVKSVTKGFLVPRMTTVQRQAVVSPAAGLLVFDTNFNCYYFYNGTSWSNISYGETWLSNGTSVYLANPNNNVGVGTSAPTGKMEVKGDASIGIDEPLFAVVNANSDTVFAVYSEGVRIWVNDDASKSTGNRGGFAVGGFNPSKALTNEYLRVTPDSVRIYINDDYIGAKASGNRGGFAVGGFSPSKGSITDDYLFVQDDSTRIYVMDSTAGFGVANLQSGLIESLMDLTTQNYFIGHQSGQMMTTGIYNQFIGYNSGFSTTTGNYNSFIGYKSGYSNIGGSGFQGGLNSFFGYLTGYSNTIGTKNTFLGYNAGFANSTGNLNVYIGAESGQYNTSGLANVFIGSDAAHDMTSGSFNTYIGFNTGHYVTQADYNTFVGSNAGERNSTGENNTNLGTFAGYYNQTGGCNVMVGKESGYFNSGSNNTVIGYMAGRGNSSGNSNIFVGYQAGYNETGSSKLYIENSNADSDNSLIYGNFATNKLQVNNYLGVKIYPSYTLDVAGTANLNNGLTGTALRVNGYEALWFNDTYFSWGYGGTFNYFADPIGIANTAPNVALDVVGSIEYTGTITDVSDIRLKENIKYIDNALERLLTIKGFSYNLIGDSLIELGVSAQDVQKVFPEVVSIVDHEKGYLGVSYIQLVPVLIEAVKEQQTIIDDQNKKISDLENKVNNLKSLESRVSELEKSKSIAKK